MPVFIRKQPLPGETLAGLIARTAAANGYRHARDVLIQSGDAGKPSSVAARAHGFLPELAEVLGVDSVRLSEMLDTPSEGRATYNFYGQSIRLIHRGHGSRRVSPRALKISDHYRGIWGLKTFSFDPKTKEILIDQCPVCDRKLGFEKTQGIAFCDWCERVDHRGFRAPAVDLRDFPQPCIEVEDVEGLDFFTDLVDPEHRGESYQQYLHDDLAGMSRVELFEVAHSIASAATAKDQKASRKSNHRRGVRELDPASLALVGRSLMDWPKTFFQMCDAAAEAAHEREPGYGLFKEIGPFAHLPLDSFITARARKTIESALKAYTSKDASPSVIRVGQYRSEEFIGIQSCGNLGSNYNRLKRLEGYPGISTFRDKTGNRSPWYFRRSEILPVIEAYKNLMTETTVANRLGLPPQGVQGLQALGLIELASGPECVMAHEDRRHYRGDQVRRLEERIIELCEGQDNATDRTSFNGAMVRFPTEIRPWAPIVQLILEGEIKASFHRTRTKTLFHAISVSGVERHRSKIQEMMAKMPSPQVDRVTVVSILQMLSLSKYSAVACMERKGLMTLDKKRTASFEQVMHFCKTYIMANEFAALIGVQTVDLARTVGHIIDPFFDLGSANGGLIYNRADVMETFRHAGGQTQQPKVA